MDFLERGNPDYLRVNELGHSYNDWLAPGGDDKTPHELLATAYWAHDASLMAQVSDTIGRPQDAARYRDLRGRIGGGVRRRVRVRRRRGDVRYADRVRAGPAHGPDPRR